MRRNPFPLVGFRSESRRAFAAAFTVLISLLPASNRTDHLSIFVPSAARGSEAPGRWSHEAALCDSISTVTYAAIGHDSHPPGGGTEASEAPFKAAGRFEVNMVCGDHGNFKPFSRFP